MTSAACGNMTIRALLSRIELIERGRAVEAADLDAMIDAGTGEDVAILCTTSGTTSNPKLAMLQHRHFLEHIAAYLRADPREPSDEYMSLLPMAWIMEQVYAVAMPAALPHPGELSGGPVNGDARSARDRADPCAAGAARLGADLGRRACAHDSMPTG